MFGTSRVFPELPRSPSVQFCFGQPNVGSRIVSVPDNGKNSVILLHLARAVLSLVGANFEELGIKEGFIYAGALSKEFIQTGGMAK